MAGKTFTTLYKQLNIDQKKAVDAIEGPVMVVAGPGTGKTQILTLRIANILKKTDTTPSTILALTFTESGVFSMRKRLVEIIGSEGYKVNIHTFHGFCNEVIKRFPDAFPRIVGASNINDLDRIALIKEIILNNEFNYLKPFGDTFYYIHAIKSKISELKRENVSPKDFEKILAKERKEYGAIDDLYYETGAHKGKMRGKYRDLEKKIAKNEELLIIFYAYEKALTKNKFYDYEDMILETIRALQSNEDLLLMLQEEYQYVLADEHQDANNAQNKLLELLTSFHANPNIFIVGDEKQAIFRFQGASLDNFLYFKSLYPEAELITLKDNYRSTQDILDSSHSLIEKSPVSDERLRVKLKSNLSGKSEKIEVRSFSNNEFELLFLADDIQKKIDEGVPPQEIAVLYRNNRDVEQIVHVLEKTQIPFIVESDQNIMSDNDIARFLVLLRAVEHFGDDSTLLPLLHSNFLNIDMLDIYKIIRYAQREKMSLFDVIKSMDHLDKANVEEGDVLLKLYKDLASWRIHASNKSVLDTVQVLAHDSGFLDYLLGHDEVVEKLEKLSGLFSDITRLIENHKNYTFEDLILYFEDLQEHNILVRKDSKNILPKSVRLMTAHKSKGLEFGYVYVVGVRDGHWGNKRSVEHFKVQLSKVKHDDFDKNDDERRLFYVAITRAKLGVSVSYVREGATGKMQLPSQFIEEIDTKFVNNIDTEKFETKADTRLLLKPGKRSAMPPLKDKEFLNALFLEQGLSVTALNNFLECPWSYFYSNLLRVPKTPTKHLMFGTAMHNVMKDFFDKERVEGGISKKTLMDLFDDHIGRQPFTESEFKEAVAKGVKALDGYFDNYHKDWITDVTNEYRISTLLPIGLPSVEMLKLRGDLDKMEVLDTKGSVNVVDYKTGKPKSRNMVSGSTKTSNGNYKRQLVFYKLLLELHDSKKYHFASGEIDFLEPDDKGRHHKEKFDITDEEVLELKESIKSTVESILDLDFWDERCDKKDCEYCDLRGKMGE